MAQPETLKAARKEIVAARAALKRASIRVITKRHDLSCAIATVGDDERRLQRAEAALTALKGRRT